MTIHRTIKIGKPYRMLRPVKIKVYWSESIQLCYSTSAKFEWCEIAGTPEDVARNVVASMVRLYELFKKSSIIDIIILGYFWVWLRYLRVMTKEEQK